MRGITVDQISGTVYVADCNNAKIRAATPGGVVGTLAGTGVAGFVDGPRGVGRLSQPQGIALSPDRTRLYIGDRFNNAIRQVLVASGELSTLAGSPSGVVTPGNVLGSSAVALLNYPCGVSAPITRPPHKF